MSKTRLILGIISSQPRGLSHDYYESVYQKSYKPCLTVLSQFPEIPFTLYYSGTLLDWLEVKHPEATMLINNMIKRKQVELLGGGYYEPILPIIQNSDGTGQIEMQTIQIRKRFGKRPRGGWLGEMIWEPGLAVTLKNSGIDYTFLDDTYFKGSGIRNDEFNFPCITEDQGKKVFIFPLDTELRNYFHENKPEESFDYLNLRLKGLNKRDSRGRNKVLSIFFDGEKWNDGGVDKWLSGFLNLIQSNRMDLNISLPSECVDFEVPLKKKYFTSLMPGKMIQENKSVTVHGTARMLTSIYPEVNLLYSKMLFVNNQIRQIRGDKSRKKSAMTGVWKAQQNRAYWYPYEMGNTFRDIRKSAYTDLIQSEMMARESGIFKPSITQYDFRMTGTDDFLYQSNKVNFYLCRTGARVFEIDYLVKPWNYQDTRCHWAETTGNRDSFIETFHTEGNQPNKSPDPKGFSLGEYHFTVEEADKDGNRIAFSLEKRIPDVNGRKRAVKINKIYSFSDKGLSVSYEIENKSDILLEFYFAVEVNLNFATPYEKLIMDYITRGVKKQDDSSERNFRDLKSVLLKDIKNKCAVSLGTSKNCELIKSTKIIKDDFFGDIYQGSRFILGWKKKADPRKSWSVELNLGFDKI